MGSKAKYGLNWSMHTQEMTQLLTFVIFFTKWGQRSPRGSLKFNLCTCHMTLRSVVLLSEFDAQSILLAIEIEF
jgi:hypothetical protein